MENENNVKVLEEVDGYKVCQWKCKGTPIKFRVSADKTEIRFDENFVHANGWMGKKSMIAAFCRRPFVGVSKNKDWVEVSEDGRFFIKGVVKLLSSVRIPREVVESVKLK